jgi:hypothetical protein
MTETLNWLASMEGVSGLCLHRGGIIKWQRLPVSVSNDRAAALCSTVSRIFAAYASAERFLKEAWFGFGPQNILVISRPGAEGTAPDTFITIFVSDKRAMHGAARGAKELLRLAAV